MSSASSIKAPTAPKVGVGCVIFRHLQTRPRPECLLIRRGKPPSLGLWSFCGGSLEIGETIIECAIREAREETGLELRHLSTAPPGVPTFYSDLRHPAVFTAVDVIDRDPDTGVIRFHYSIPEVAAVPENYRAVPQASDDADDVQWVDVAELKSLPELVPNAIEVVEEALARFKIPVE